MAIEKERACFNAYVQGFDLEQDQNRLKVIHTMHVVKIMQQIGGFLNLSDREMEVAETIALFHDIGRFEQFKRYNTFVDHQSIDHADLGKEILERSNFLDRFSGKEQQQILMAIQFHNKYELVPMDEKTMRYAKMIRDADKCDILRVFAFEPIESTTSTSYESIQNDVVSEEIEAMIHNHQCIDKTKRKTGLDIWMTVLGFFFDVNYPITMGIMKKQGYYRLPFDRIRFRRAQKQVDSILSEIENYIARNS